MHIPSFCDCLNLSSRVAYLAISPAPHGIHSRPIPTLSKPNTKMPVDIPSGSPLAETLQNDVQQKLMELGWSTSGLDDSAMAEYIVLSVSGGKNEQDVASELSELLSPEDVGIQEFVTWLFQHAQALTAGETMQSVSDNKTELDRSGDAQMKAEDAEMEVDATGDVQADGSMYAARKQALLAYLLTFSRPTGPKSMRTRDKRMLGQLNKALDRSGDKVLHRVKGAGGGVGRINSSHGREPPKGPASRGPRGTMNRLANMPGPQRQMNAMNQMGMNNPATALANLTPQQQMQLMAMYEQQAKMMAEIFNPQQQQHSGGGGKSLFERVGNGPPRQNHFNKKTHNHASQNGAEADPGSSMEVEPGSQTTPNQDHDTTMCRFNLTCTKPDCYFVHQSPAAPPGVAVDMSDTCSFGAACKNRKCTGKHPSPAKLGPQRAEQECKFFPNCTNVACPFKHPAMPPCRNGADCTVANCKFFHVKTPCKFDPCLNPSCPFKHTEGQKRGSYNDKVWVNPEGEDGKQHVSDRKFVDETAGEEELIVPVKAEIDGIVT